MPSFNPYTGRLEDREYTKTIQKSGYSEEDKEHIKNLIRLSDEADRQQAFALKAQSDAIDNLKTGNDLAPLASLVDAWTGSNFAQSYKAPITEEDKANIKLKIQKELADQRSDSVRAKMGAIKNASPSSTYIIGTDPTAAALGKQLAQSNITGYNITDPSRVIPSQKDAEELKGGTSSLFRLEQNQKLADKNLQEANLLDRLGAVKIPLTDIQVGTQRGRLLDSEIKDMLLEGKEMQKLGALQKPDLEIMEGLIGGTTGVGSLLQSKDEVRARLQEYLDRGRANLELMAKSRGYTPQPGYLGSSLAKDEKLINGIKYKKVKGGWQKVIP